ncbi:hypothetical protein M9Y10_026676 [Tritrichomonas musculus]|uniref:Uncharacterized protein n=1 Tax=Tritrichomonas musculus TaxID=1915356 RepID=A0ABR2H7A4_9EUKA
MYHNPFYNNCYEPLPFRQTHFGYCPNDQMPREQEHSENIQPDDRGDISTLDSLTLNHFPNDLSNNQPTISDSEMFRKQIAYIILGDSSKKISRENIVKIHNHIRNSILRIYNVQLEELKKNAFHYSVDGYYRKYLTYKEPILECIKIEREYILKNILQI